MQPKNSITGNLEFQVSCLQNGFQAVESGSLNIEPGPSLLSVPKSSSPETMRGPRPGDLGARGSCPLPGGVCGAGLDVEFVNQMNPTVSCQGTPRHGQTKRGTTPNAIGHIDHLETVYRSHCDGGGSNNLTRKKRPKYCVVPHSRPPSVSYNAKTVRLASPLRHALGWPPWRVPKTWGQHLQETTSASSLLVFPIFCLHRRKQTPQH
jgi:hypothetical protein